MRLNGLDAVIILISLAVSFLPVVVYARRAARGAEEFFASGRAAPWWLIGTSMVATTFSTDTPNLVTNMVRTKGVADNWEWWAFLLTGMATVFFYARLWRRLGVLTDLEFYELRYSGRSAAFLRGFRAVYLGLCFNCVIMATVTLAAVKIANVMLGWDSLRTVIVCAALCILFGSISGLWGVLMTDLIQFVIAMFGVIAAAWYALQHPAVGGLAGLMEKTPAGVLSLVPDFGNWELALSAMIIPLAVQWWSVWYPGAEPGGGSYIAQRMLAARNEKDAMAGTLWFSVAHYALRPWPWIVVALCSMLVYPSLDDIRTALPHVSGDLIGHDMAYPAMLTLLPHGLLGLVVASLLAAYVSTMITHMNWGTSYLVLDFYRRFLARDAAADLDPHRDEAARTAGLIWLSRAVSAALMVVSALLSLQIESAKAGFDLMLSIGAGTGLIYLLRWYWWRINAWSEITAMAVSFLVAAAVFVAAKWGISVATHWQLLGTVAVTTVAWLGATLLTAPTDEATLVAFYRRVRPGGRGWARVRQAAGGIPPDDSLWLGFQGFALGCVMIYSALFLLGSCLYGNWAAAGAFLAAAAASGVGVRRVFLRIWKASRI